MKGFGTDEDALINVLCRRTSAQRMEIVRMYKNAFGKDLISDIKSETSGNFERILVSLLMPTGELYAKEIRDAISGAGTDETALIEVMCMLTNYEIKCIAYAYYQKYGRSLEEELRGDTSGHFKRLMTSLSVGGRDESMTTNVNSAKADAVELKRAGVDKWGTDESTFQRILCTRNYEQLKLIAQEYERLAGKTLENDIKSEFSGDIEDGLLAILRTAINRPESFAIRLHKSMAGLGTNDNSLIRLVVTRSEIDLEDIKEAFLRKYGKTLKSFIKGDTSGHYKHALYALTGENRS
jgi:annexin A7/11